MLKVLLGLLGLFFSGSVDGIRPQSQDVAAALAEDIAASALRKAAGKQQHDESHEKASKAEKASTPVPEEHKKPAAAKPHRGEAHGRLWEVAEPPLKNPWGDEKPPQERPPAAPAAASANSKAAAVAAAAEAKTEAKKVWSSLSPKDTPAKAHAEDFKAKMAARKAEMQAVLKEYSEKKGTEQQKKLTPPPLAPSQKRTVTPPSATGVAGGTWNKESPEAKALAAEKDAAAKDAARQKVLEYRAKQKARRAKAENRRILEQTMGKPLNTTATDSLTKHVVFTRAAEAEVKQNPHVLIAAVPAPAPAGVEVAAADKKTEEKKVDRFDGKKWTNPKGTDEDWMHSPKASDDADFLKDSTYVDARVKPPEPPAKSGTQHLTVLAPLFLPLLAAGVALHVHD